MKYFFLCDLVQNFDLVKTLLVSLFEGRVEIFTRLLVLLRYET